MKHINVHIGEILLNQLPLEINQLKKVALIFWSAVYSVSSNYHIGCILNFVYDNVQIYIDFYTDWGGGVVNLPVHHWVISEIISTVAEQQIIKTLMMDLPTCLDNVPW